MDHFCLLCTCPGDQWQKEGEYEEQLSQPILFAHEYITLEKSDSGIEYELRSEEGVVDFLLAFSSPKNSSSGEGIQHTAKQIIKASASCTSSENIIASSPAVHPTTGMDSSMATPSSLSTKHNQAAQQGTVSAQLEHKLLNRAKETPGEMIELPFEALSSPDFIGLTSTSTPAAAVSGLEHKGKGMTETDGTKDWQDSLESAAGWTLAGSRSQSKELSGLHTQEDANDNDNITLDLWLTANSSRFGLSTASEEDSGCDYSEAPGNIISPVSTHTNSLQAQSTSEHDSGLTSEASLSPLNAALQASGMKEEAEEEESLSSFSKENQALGRDSQSNYDEAFVNNVVYSACSQPVTEKELEEEVEEVREWATTSLAELSADFESPQVAVRHTVSAGAPLVQNTPGRFSFSFWADCLNSIPTESPVQRKLAQTRQAFGPNSRSMRRVLKFGSPERDLGIESSHSSSSGDEIEQGKCTKLWLV